MACHARYQAGRDPLGTQGEPEALGDGDKGMERAVRMSQVPD